MIHLTIDDQAVEVPQGWSILDACRELQIPIPTLCYHPALEPVGACRLCMVELAQPPRPRRMVASCVTPCEEGQAVWTSTSAVARTRRMMAELLLATAPRNPYLLGLAIELGVTSIRFTLPEENTCVLCGLCVRACSEIVGVRAISLIGRGMAKKVSPPFEISSSTCIGCGTCVLICPTGFLDLDHVTRYRSDHPAVSDFERLECQVCGEYHQRPHEYSEVGALLGRKVTYD